MSGPRARFGDGLTVGESVLIRTVGFRYGAGEPFCVTRELLDKGGTKNRDFFRALGRAGIDSIALELVGKRLLKKETGRYRYSLTEEGAGEYLKLSDTFRKPGFISDWYREKVAARGGRPGRAVSDAKGGTE